MSFIASKRSDYKFLVDDSTSEEGMNRSHEDNLVMTELITDQITQVTNAYQKSNYTFSLTKQSGADGNYFLNLVVKEYKESFYLYIVKYVPDALWLNAHSMTNDMGDFTGSIYFYSDQGVYVANLTMQSGSTTAYSYNNCPEDTDDGIDYPDDDGTGGTGDGGGSGSTCFIVATWYQCQGDNASTPHSASSCNAATGSQTGSGYNYTYYCTDNNYSANNLNDVLRNPCGSGGSGGGGNTSCQPDPNNPCEIPYTLDEACNCVLAEAIENNEVAVNTNPLKDGCIKLNAITDNVDVKQKIASLITSSNNYNYEEGFKIVKYQGQIAAGQIENDNSSNAPDCQAVSTSIHQQVSTFVHSHPVNCNVFGMFSGFDLMVLAQIAKLYNDGDGIASNNYKDPTIMLAYQNTVFALTIDNMQAMNALINIYEDPIKQRKLLKKLNKKFNKSVPNGSQTANIGDLIVDLLNALDDFNLNGLGFYQAEVDNNNMVTNWNRKKLTNNGTNFETENCN